MSKKNKTMIDRDVEIQGAKMLGRHVSKKKGRVLLVVTTIACVLPMLLGMQLWEQIPETVSTGLIGANGQDDSLPRWAVVFAIPALMCLLNLICHLQLLGYQKRMQIPPAKFRIVGRWGFPVISVLFSGGFIRECAGLAALPMTFLTPCVLGLLLMILGAHLYDCAEDTKLSLNFSFLSSNPALKAEVNRFAGQLWLLAGLLAVGATMVTGTSGWVTAVLILAALMVPWLYGRGRAGSR